MNTNIKRLNQKQHEIITNAEHALEDGEITREQRDEIIKSCIASETERLMLDTTKGN